MRRPVFFDLDDTLFDWPTAVERTLEKMQKEFLSVLGGLPMPVMRDLFLSLSRLVFEAPAFRAFSLADQRRARFEMFLSNLGKPFDKALELNDFYYANFVAEGALLPYAVETLKEVGDTNDLGILSNGIRAVQIKKLEQNGLVGAFKWIVFSEDAQVTKPSAGIFEFAARKAGVSDGAPLPVFVGNDLIKDMWGAKRAGWRTIWFNPGGDDAHEYSDFIDKEVEALSAVPAALGELMER